MNQTKAAVTSVGFWGTLIASLVALANLAGVDISGSVTGMDAEISGVFDKAFVLVAAVIGLYGRFKATAQITGLFTPKK